MGNGDNHKDFGICGFWWGIIVGEEDGDDGGGRRGWIRRWSGATCFTAMTTNGESIGQDEKDFKNSTT